MNPTILSATLEAGRIQIVHTSGRLTVVPSVLFLRPAGSTFALHVKASRSGIYLREISAETADQLADLGVRIEGRRPLNRGGWTKSTFQIRLGDNSDPFVCGVTRNRMGIYRNETGPADKRWSLTDLPSGLALGYFRTQPEARKRADEIDSSPELLAKIEAQSLKSQKENPMKSETPNVETKPAILTCVASDGTTVMATMHKKELQPAIYGNRKAARAAADRAIASGMWNATPTEPGPYARGFRVVLEPVVAAEPEPLTPTVWTETSPGVFDHASGRATVTGTSGGKWVAILDGSMLSEGKATRHFSSAETAMGAAEDEMAVPSEQPAPRSLRAPKAAKRSRGNLSLAPKPESATDGLTAGQRAAKTKGPDRLREIAAKAAATRAANKAAQAKEAVAA